MWKVGRLHQLKKVQLFFSSITVFRGVPCKKKKNKKNTYATQVKRSAGSAHSK